MEIIPPTADTDLDRGARGTRGQTDREVQPAEVAKAAVEGIEQDLCEIAVGAAQGLVAASRASFEQVFARMNGGVY